MRVFFAGYVLPQGSSTSLFISVSIARSLVDRWSKAELTLHRVTTIFRHVSVRLPSSVSVPILDHIGVRWSLLVFEFRKAFR